MSYGQGFACSLSPPGVTCLADTLGRILGERLSSSWGSVTTVFGLGLSEIQRPPVGKGRGGRTTPILSDNVDLTTSSRSHRPPTGVNRRQHDALPLGVLHSCHSTAVAVKLRHRSHSGGLVAGIVSGHRGSAPAPGVHQGWGSIPALARSRAIPTRCDTARPRHQGDAVEGAETQRSRAGREGPQPQSAAMESSTRGTRRYSTS